MVKLGNYSPILGKWDFMFLLGESGGGKGTLVKNLKKYWLPDIYTASMGDIFREKSKTDPEIKRLTDEGILINDELVGKYFREFALDCHPGIMDGFPRNRQQALDAVKFVKENNWRILVIDLHCDIEVIIERLLSRGREDDKLSIMHKRNMAHKTLHPAVMEEMRMRHDHFDVIKLDGNKSAEVAFTEFLLEVLRLVDLLNLYDMPSPKALFKVTEDETSVNHAVNRWVCQILGEIQQKIDNEK